MRGEGERVRGVCERMRGERESAKPLLSRLLLRGVFRFPTLDVGDQLAVEKVLTLNPKA